MRIAAGFAICLIVGAVGNGCARDATKTLQQHAPRIITLAPSLTEIAYSIGCGKELVGDTLYDAYPSPAGALPHVADLKSVDLERVAALAPTVVLALHDQEHEGAGITGRLGVRVVYLPNRNLDDLYADIAGVADACDRVKQGDDLATNLRAQIAAIQRQASRRPTHPRVLFLLGLPGFTAGKRSYLDDLIGIAGGVNVAGGIDQAYPNLSDEAILNSDPDIIIVPRDTSFGPDVQTMQPWSSMRAVRDHRIVSPPDDDILERNGPRVVSGLTWLSGVFAR